MKAHLQIPLPTINSNLVWQNCFVILHINPCYSAKPSDEVDVAGNSKQAEKNSFYF